MSEKPVFEMGNLKEFIEQAGITPMGLVRICGISVTSAYKIAKGQPMSDLNVLYKVYSGLKAAGHEVTWVQITGIE